MLDLASAGIGFASALALGGISFGIGRHLHYRCKEEGCHCGTNVTYRLFRHNLPRTKSGKWVHTIYKFRWCKNGHIIVATKTKAFTDEQLRQKELAGEFDWTSDFIRNLCELAGIKNPAEEQAAEAVQKPTTIVSVVVVGGMPCDEKPESQLFHRRLMN